jgi:peptide/nickel transport system substrate-binding protein
MRKLIVVLAALVGFGVLGVAADPGILTVVMTTDPPNIDPAVVTDYEAGIVTFNVYEGLLDYNLADYTIKPALATNWEIAPDGKSAIFTLRQGVKFHDGTPFNADAVKYSIERTQAMNQAPATYLAPITKIEVLDPYKIKLSTDTTWAFWEDALATRKALGIVSPTYVKAHITASDPWAAEWMGQHTCGTGPYVLEDWQIGQYVKLVKNANYWGGWKPEQFSTVFIKTVREPAVEELMIKSGEADIAFDVPETDLATLDKDPNIYAKSLPGMAQLFFPMKCSKGPFQDIRIRKAVTYALDLDEIATVYPGAEKAQGAIPRSMLGADPTAPIYPHDPEAARLLLAEAGYKPGALTLTLTYVAGAEWERRAALIAQQNLADVGINLKVESMPWSVIFPLLADPAVSPDWYIFYSAARFADPHGIMWETFSTVALGPSGFNNGYSNTAFDTLLDEATRTPDREARAALYRQANRILIQDMPAIFVWEMPYSFVHRESVKGMVPELIDRTYHFYDLYRG